MIDTWSDAGTQGLRLQGNSSRTRSSRLDHQHVWPAGLRGKLRAALVVGLASLMGWGPLPGGPLGRISSAAASQLDREAHQPSRPLISNLALSQPDQATSGQAIKAYGKMPMSFEANLGQADERVKFLSQGSGYRLFLTATEAVLQLRIADCGLRIDGTCRSHRNILNPQSAIRNPHSAVLRMGLVGANPEAQAEGLDQLEGKSNYFTGRDPKQWRTGVPHYAKVRYRNIYDGIDLVYYGHQHQLEYDFVVAPGADPGLIKLTFRGARRLHIDAHGELVLRTVGGEVRQHRPVIYQEVDGAKRPVAGRYVITGRHEVGFKVEAYDPSRRLVIDPVLSYSTYLGSNGNDNAFSLAADSAGNIYLAGNTTSTNFPLTPGAISSTYAGGARDAFVTKLNAAGTAIVYSTFLGGSGSDQAQGIAVDSAGNAYVTGETDSVNFPTTPGAFRTAYSGGGRDAFVAKLNASGTALVYATFLGGNGVDSGQGIAVDSAGNAFVVGETDSGSFPTTPGVFRNARAGGNDSFATKLNAAGTDLIYSTYLSGTLAAAVAIDAGGNAYVTGRGIPGLPTTPGAFQATFGGGFSDAFVMKLNPTATALGYLTYVGGNKDDRGTGIAVDLAGNAYIAGETVSTNLPTTPGALGASFGGGLADAFAAKLNPNGTALVYATYLGGSDIDRGSGIAVDSGGNAYVTGSTLSTNFPTTGGAMQPAKVPGPGLDAFVTRLNAAGAALFSTYLGGTDDDAGTAVALDPVGNAYVVGNTFSTNFPTTSGIVQPAKGGGQSDVFIAKFGAEVNSVAVVSVSAANYRVPPLASESIVAAFGTSLATDTQVATSTPLPTSLAGTSVKVRDSLGVERLAPLFFVSPGQINLQIPAGTATGTATVIVVNGSGVVSAGTALITAVAPGIFSANNDGQGAAAAVALRARADGSQSFESVAQFNGTKFVPLPLDLGPGSDQVFLILFGTGLRFRSSLPAVTVKIGGIDAQVLYAGPQGGFVGLDQLNVAVPRSLIGRGEVDVVLTVDGQTANTVRVNIR